MFRPSCLLALVLIAFTGCAGNRDTHELLNSLLWMQTSAEYDALASTTYRQAARHWVRVAGPHLERATGANRDILNRPPAVILDVDETVLDNSAFDARLVTHRTTFSPSAWDAWVREADACRPRRIGLHCPRSRAGRHNPIHHQQTGPPGNLDASDT